MSVTSGLRSRCSGTRGWVRPTDGRAIVCPVVNGYDQPPDAIVPTRRIGHTCATGNPVQHTVARRAGQPLVTGNQEGVARAVVLGPSFLDNCIFGQARLRRLGIAGRRIVQVADRFGAIGGVLPRNLSQAVVGVFLKRPTSRLGLDHVPGGVVPGVSHHRQRLLSVGLSGHSM